MDWNKHKEGASQMKAFRSIKEDRILIENRKNREKNRKKTGRVKGECKASYFCHGNKTWDSSKWTRTSF